MLTITQLHNGKLSIKCHYFYRQRIREIPTSSFDPDTKEWTIESFMLGMLESKFKGELVYKTPRWVILNESAPDMSAMYEIHDKSIKCPSLKIKPYDYQDFGIRFMIDKLNKYGFVILADIMGAGKTLQSIGAMKWYMENKGVNKTLVICKKSIKSQWKDEVKKFTDLCDNDNAFFLDYTSSTAGQRNKIYNAFRAASKGILITNHHSFLNDVNMLKQLNVDFVIVDECHSVKARNGKINNNIGNVIRGKPIIFLTGTPILSRPEDIFGIVQMADPSYFGSYKEFKNMFLVEDRNNKFGPQIVGAKNLDILRDKVQDIVLRRTEYEISVQLPSVVLQTKKCDMDKTQENILIAIKEKQEALTDAIERLTAQSKGVDTDKILSLRASVKSLIAARQAASSDPRMFLMSRSKYMVKAYGSMVPNSYKMSPKTEAMLETIEDIISNGDKVILFTKFSTCAQLAAQDINSTLKQQALLYTGLQSEKQREDALYLFKNTSTFNILIGTEALSEGVNLQVAKYVINIDQPDTFAIKGQRIGRVKRIGSAFNNVIVYDLITKDSPKAKSKDVERLQNIINNQDLTDALVTLDPAQKKALINAMKSQ